jgi:hypothetical protein
LEFYELKGLGMNPKDPGLIDELDEIVDRYILRANQLIGAVELQQRGEVIRQRLHQVGSHGTTSLFVVGKK